MDGMTERERFNARGMLYLGTENGLYVSVDDGATCRGPLGLVAEDDAEYERRERQITLDHEVTEHAEVAESFEKV